MTLTNFFRRDIGFLGDHFPESKWENSDKNVITNLGIEDKKKEEEKSKDGYDGMITRW